MLSFKEQLTEVHLDSCQISFPPTNLEHNTKYLKIGKSRHIFSSFSQFEKQAKSGEHFWFAVHICNMHEYMEP